VSERGTGSGVGCHGLTTETNACHFTWNWKAVNTLLCYTLVSILVLGIGIGSGQYYWILGCFLGIVLTLVFGLQVCSFSTIVVMYDIK